MRPTLTGDELAVDDLERRDCIDAGQEGFERTKRLRPSLIISDVSMPGLDGFDMLKLKSTGSGLGLAICRDIVSKLGGTISVESAQDRGTTFTILLPIASTGDRTSAKGGNS